MTSKAGCRKLYLITKLQNLKAIHNGVTGAGHIVLLYLITKLQNLKAIHNGKRKVMPIRSVVSNYKITKSESYSQPKSRPIYFLPSCI